MNQVDGLEFNFSSGNSIPEMERVSKAFKNLITDENQLAVSNERLANSMHTSVGAAQQMGRLTSGIPAKALSEQFIKAANAAGAAANASGKMFKQINFGVAAAFKQNQALIAKTKQDLASGSNFPTQIIEKQVKQIRQIATAFQEGTLEAIKMNQAMARGSVLPTQNIEKQVKQIHQVTTAFQDGTREAIKMNQSMARGSNLPTQIIEKQVKQIRQVTTAFQDGTREAIKMNQAMSRGSVLPTQTGTRGLRQVRQIDPSIDQQLAGVRLRGSALPQIRAVTVATNAASHAADRLGFTWRTAIRIFESFVIYRGIYAIGNTLRMATESAIDFEIKLSQIRTISQHSQLSFNQWGDAVRRLSDEFGNPIMDVAAATYEVISNQIGEGAKAIEFMTEAQKLSLVTFASAKDSINALSGIMNAYGLGTEYTETISAKLFKTVDLGRISMADLGNSLGDVSSISALLNINIDELLSAISAITIRSVTPAHSMTQLRNIFSQLLKPSKDMEKTLKALGYNSAEAMFKVEGLESALGKLVSQKPDMEGLADIFRNIRGFAGAAILTKDVKTFTGDIAEMKQAVNDYLRATSIAMESNGKNVQIEVNRIKNYLITQFGQDILKFAVTVTKSFGGLDNIFKTFAQNIYSILIPALIALMATLTKLTPIMAANPIAAIAIGATTAIIALKTYYDMEQNLINSNAERQMAAWDEVTKRRLNNSKIVFDNAVKASFEESRVSLRAVAQLNAGLDAIKNKALENAILIKDFVEHAMQEAMDRMRDMVTDLNSKVTTAQTALKKVIEAQRDFQHSKEERLFQDSLVGQSPSKQIEIYRDEINRLVELGRKSTNISDADEYFKKALDHAAKIDDITKQYGRDITKIEKEKAKLQKEYEREDTKLRKKQESHSTKKNIIDKGAIKEQRENLKIAHEAKMAELETSKITAGGIKLTPEQVTKGTNKILYEQERKQAELRGRATVDAFTAEMDAAIADWKRQQITDVQRRLDDQKVKDIFKIKDTDKMTEEYNKLLKLQEEEISAYILSNGYLDEKQVANDKIVQSLREQLQLNKDALKAEQDLRSVAKTNEPIEKQIKDITAQYEEQKRLKSLKEEEIVALQRKLKQDEVNREAARESAKGRILASEVWNQDQSGEEKIIQEEAASRGFTIADPEEIKRRIAKAEKEAAQMKEEITKLLGELPTEIKDIIVANEKVKTNTEHFATAISEVERVTLLLGTQLDLLNNKLNKINAAQGLNIGPLKADGTFAFGGMPTSGTDSILAMLSPGEYVVNAKAAKQYYSQLVAMNSGIPAFSRGGPVTNISGDFNISLQPSGNTSVDVQEIGRLLRREIRRGTVSLS